VSQLTVRMFGKFCVRRNGEAVRLDASKLQELFCYLLINRQSPHPRESLAALLWEDSSTAQSKKYLRQALWNLQAALDCEGVSNADRVLLVEPNWVSLSPTAGIWLDVAVFEQSFAFTREVAGQHLDTAMAQALDDAVQLYQGDLMEGCYRDWCLYERERLQSAYLIMLDKLMGYCESHQEYEAGLGYGHRIMRYERARESTHRRLMRLYYLAGDRTAALRQYARCVEALAEELGVKPDKRTMALYDQIRADEFKRATPLPACPGPSPDAGAVPLSEVSEVMDHLKQLRVVLTGIQCRVQEDIQAVDIVLNRPQ
jgi:DNA-binding SARP family transcriptional activator